MRVRLEFDFSVFCKIRSGSMRKFTYSSFTYIRRFLWIRFSLFPLFNDQMFGTLEIEIWDLPFDVAQGGEPFDVAQDRESVERPVEPFAI
jgi:hypothetical protein